MATVVRESIAGHAWVARPGRALSPVGGRRLILVAAGLSFGIAIAFAGVGAWPVLPFAGLEIACLWAAQRHLRRRADDEERIDLNDRLLIVTRRQAGRTERHEFNRYWVGLHVDRTLGAPVRLLLRGHGREVEIGRNLTDTEKRELAAALRTGLAATDKPSSTTTSEEGN